MLDTFATPAYRPNTSVPEKAVLQRSTFGRPQRQGFTLIEVLAVVVILGLLAAATAWSLAGSAQRATRGDTVDRLIHTDALARLAARRLGESTLRIDLDAQELRVVHPDSAPGHRQRLPRGYRIDGVLTPVPEDAGNSDLRRARTQGVFELSISGAGLSNSYALELTGPPDPPEPGASAGLDPDRQTTLWLVFSGLSGACSLHDDRNVVEELFEMLSEPPSLGEGPVKP